MRRQAGFPASVRLAVPAFRPAIGLDFDGTAALAAVAARLDGRAGRLLGRLAGGLALVLLIGTVALLLLRLSHADRIYPAIVVADVPIGGQTRDEAALLLRQRADAILNATVAFSYDGRVWQARLGEVGLTADPEAALAAAYAFGREPDAWQRLQVAADLIRDDQRLPLPLRLDHAALGRWFDAIDRDLGATPRDAALTIEGTQVEIVPEVDGIIVDRPAAIAAVTRALGALAPLNAPLPTVTQPAAVRAADLVAVRDRLRSAMAVPVQVTYGGGIWTLPPGELSGFVTQTIDPTKRGAAAFSLAMDRAALADWLEARLAPAINREPRDAEVGWNGERLVSVVESVDGLTLQAAPLADRVAESFFGGRGAVEATVLVEPPTIDSKNLGALGITTSLGRGTSNYAGSSDGRATNVELGAALLNGALIPPHGEFSFNNSIGAITEEKGFVEAQVIVGEGIGTDIGGGICQVSTTVFRAAYFAGLPITEWWPHRFRIPFYEYDGWPPGLDAAIFQPTEDPATWDDFRFENPTDSWMLVESWTDGVNVVVNIYGADLGWRVESDGPVYGEKFRMLPDQEKVDRELQPGTINQVMVADVGEEMSHTRRVFDRGGKLLWERSFYTKYFPKGNVWEVSPDMAGKSPADPDREPPPLPLEPNEQPVTDASG